MSTSKSVTFSVVNNTGREMPTLWANHSTSSSGGISLQSYVLTNVASGSAPVTLGNMQIVSRTDDVFTVMWTDSFNNLYGLPYNYSTEADMDGGNVQLVLQGGTFQFFQTDEGSLGDPAPYLQYEIGLS